MESYFFKRVNTQNLHSSVQRSRQFESLVQDGDEQIHRHRDPHLRLHRVGRRAVEVLDAKVLFDPPEEEFYLPTALVEQSGSGCRHLEMIGQKDQLLARVGIDKTDSPKQRSKGLARFGRSRPPDLVAGHAAAAGFRAGCVAGETQVVFGPGDKEGTGRGDPMQAGEIHVTAIEKIEGSGLEDEFVEPEHIVARGRANIDQHGDRAAQVDLRVHLDARLARAEIGPRKQGQREIYGRRVQRVDRVVQVQPEVFSGIELARPVGKPRGQIAPQTPVALFVGFGQSHARHRPAKTEMVERVGPFGIEAFLDVAQALPPCELGESHADQLLPAAEVPRADAVAFDEAVEDLPVDALEDLGEDVAAGVHEGRFCAIAPPSSNPSHPFFPASHSFSAHRTK